MYTLRITILLFLLLFWTKFSGATNYDSLYHHAMGSIFATPDLATEELNECLSYFEESHSFDKTISTKLKLTSIHAGRGNYQLAYDLAWELMPLIEEHGTIVQKIGLYRTLVSMYTIFCQYDKAHSYLDKAFVMAKQIDNSGMRAKWLTTLHSTAGWLYTNSTNDLEKAKQCLFKAMEENAKFAPDYGNFYIEMQLGDLYVQFDSLKKAQEILLPLKKKTQKRFKSTQSLLYDHLGMMYMKLGQYEKAIASFTKCIAALDRYKNHLDNKVTVLDSLAQCYHYQSNSERAFFYSKQAIEMRDELFGTRTSKNRELYEIKNSYQDKIQEQNLKLLRREKQVLNLRLILYTTVLLSVILVLIFRTNRKAKQQKRLYERQSKAKKKKEEELEVKNKELLSSALQLIERDALLEEIRTTLHSLSFKSNNKKSISELISAIRANKAKNWDEFNLYFTTVNEGYYQTLKLKYPKLSNTDLKMCALIKIGFSSKEMAEVMGIGADSVKTSRSRIRKKMSIERDVNLSALLGEIQ